MLGVVLLSEYNELVHAFGNSQFRQHFFTSGGRSYSEGNGQLSSSSGVSSSASTTTSPKVHHESAEKVGPSKAIQESPGDEEDNYNGPNKDEEPLFDESLLLQQLMPLVALCRTRGQTDSGHQIQCIQSGDLLQVRVASLPFSNLMILIHAFDIFPIPTSSDCLFQSLIRCINFHYGPQIQLIPMNTTLVQKLRRRCEQRMLGILTQAEDSRQFPEYEIPFANPNLPFNQNISIGGTQKFIQTALMPKLRELTQLIAQRIGRRCIFLHSGRLMASISSHSPSESVLTSLESDQLLSILQFTRQPGQQEGNPHSARNPTSLKCQTEHVWLQSKTFRRIQLHNAFVVSLSGSMEMICLATIEQSQLIAAISECLDSLEQIGTHDAESLRTQLAKCQQHMECIHKLLAKFNTRQLWIGKKMLVEEWTEWDGLYELPKTRALIQHLWIRFRSSLMMFLDKMSPASSTCSLSQTVASHFHASTHSLLNDGDEDEQLFNQQQNESTISSVYSTLLEWSSLSAATPTHSSSSGRPLTVQMEAQRTQLKRVLRQLLNELLTWSASMAQHQTLPMLQASIRHLMGNHLASSFRALDKQIEGNGANLLRPANLGLDMLAYKFTRPIGTPLNFQFIADEEKELFVQLVEAFPIGVEKEAGEELMVARMADGKLILQTKCSQNANALQSKRRPLGRHLKFPFGKFMRSKDASVKEQPQGQQFFHSIMLFSRHVNLGLAMKQAQKLMDKLADEMEQCQRNFQ